MITKGWITEVQEIKISMDATTWEVDVIQQDARLFLESRFSAQNRNCTIYFKYEEN